MSWKGLIIIIGAEWAPDAGIGLEQLQISGDGEVRYEHRLHGEISHAAGRLAPEALRALNGGLREAGFPAVPPHDIPPGGALMEIRLDDAAGQQRVLLDYHAGAHFAGYRELRALATRWCDSLRSGNGADGALDVRITH